MQNIFLVKVQKGFNMKLEKNQITQLLIWVHPDWNFVGNDIIINWSKLIDFVNSKDNFALIQAKGRKNYNDGLISMRYGEEGFYLEHIKSLQLLEKKAREKLDKRYLLWEECFINGKDNKHINIIRDSFNIEERTFEVSSDNKLVKTIGCYGLNPGDRACVAYQTKNCNLDRISYSSTNFGLYPNKEILQ